MNPRNLRAKGWLEHGAAMQVALVLAALAAVLVSCQDDRIRVDGSTADGSRHDNSADRPVADDGSASLDGRRAEELSRTDGSALGSYDKKVLAKKPVGYWRVAATKGDEVDLSGRGHAGRYNGSAQRSTVALPNGGQAVEFNGQDQFLEIPDSDDFSVSSTGQITIEAWLSPSVLQFAKSQGGYVHWMGKGVNGQHEWVARIYDLVNTASRPNRISGYAFNLSGGLGAGSYFEDKLTAKMWIHYALVINTAKSSTYPMGYTKIFRDGKLRDQDSLADYNIVPQNGTAPLRIGTRDLGSFFQGGIAKVAIYPRELSPAEIAEQTAAMAAP